MATQGEIKRGDIVTYASPHYGHNLRVRVQLPFVTPEGKQAWDAVIINEAGEPDIEGYFFTGVWFTEDQVVSRG